jgi:hypothetical protein
MGRKEKKYREGKERTTNIMESSSVVIQPGTESRKVRRYITTISMKNVVATMTSKSRPGEK